MIDVATNYRKIIDQIGEAAVKGRRDAWSVRLLAAAKSQSAELMQAAFDAGVTLIGENYVQEALEKKRTLNAPAEWHMIGHLQRNKVRMALDLFEVIETLDSVVLAHELDKEGRKRGRIIRAFVEVNLGGEKSKSGVVKTQLRPFLQETAGFSFLRIEGFMTVPPFQEDIEAVRPFFRELKELRDELRELRLPNAELGELSMGMSHDYTVAVEEGATIVRVGTALFGPRSN